MSIPSERTDLTRREVFSCFSRPFRFFPGFKSLEAPLVEDSVDAKKRKAIIQGRYCLAYQNGFCSVCREHCPEPGALRWVDNVPSIDLERCTGCALCHEVCPAPKNAVLLISE